MGVGGESHIDLKFCFIQRAAAPGMGNICYPQQSSHSSLFLATRVLEAMYKCYTFLFLFFLQEKYTKSIPSDYPFIQCRRRFKIVSQTAHLCGRNTKKGDSLHFIYIYIKHMGICFLHGLVFVSNLQWVSNKKKNNSTRQILPTKSHH